MKNLKKRLAECVKLTSIPSSCVSQLLKFYQHTLSADHGPAEAVFGNWRCRFYPSCSDYTLTAIRQYGLLKGSVVSLKRILRCHPWNPGGYDPVA